MPEGDTIFRAAATMQRALGGRVVTRFESMYPALTRIDHDQPLAGRVVESVTSRGKHLLMTFSGDLILRTHMRMNGSWHLYRPGERWQRPSSAMRVLVATDAFIAVGFDIPVAEFLTSRDLSRHQQLQSLGPDLAGPAFDREEARVRIHAQGDEPLHALLLDQRVIAGIGNVLKSEVLFVAGLDPFAPARLLDDARCEKLLDVALRLMKMNTAERTATLSPTRGRRTTGSLNPAVDVWVYGRAGKQCRRCGTIIQVSRSGDTARPTYWCPRCQPPLRPGPQVQSRGDGGSG